MADSPLPPGAPYIKCTYRGPGRSGAGLGRAGPGPGAPYIKYIQGEWGEGVREWGGCGRAGPGQAGSQWALESPGPKNLFGWAHVNKITYAPVF
jgi:hypothetical protein